MQFDRPKGFMGGKPRDWIDNKLPNCPFCKLPSLWEYGMELKFMGYSRYHFRCPNCLAIISVPVPTVAGGLLIIHSLIAGENMKIDSMGKNDDVAGEVGEEYPLEVFQKWARKKEII